MRGTYRAWSNLPFQRAKKYVFFRAGPGPGNPQIRPEMGAPGPPDILGLSSEIIGSRNLGGGPVGHPQGAQDKTLIFNIKYLPKVSHVVVTTRLCFGMDI